MKACHCHGKIYVKSLDTRFFLLIKTYKLLIGKLIISKNFSLRRKYNLVAIIPAEYSALKFLWLDMYEKLDTNASKGVPHQRKFLFVRAKIKAISPNQ
ncbi:hypothetical protein AMR41_24950 [Hapalosiphon sp. MRB220]|nr:hypothetical protein AMR41_24950 [Hapalosiphon sp. MRB220]